MATVPLNESLVTGDRHFTPMLFWNLFIGLLVSPLLFFFSLSCVHTHDSLCSVSNFVFFCLSNKVETIGLIEDLWVECFQFLEPELMFVFASVCKAWCRMFRNFPWVQTKLHLNEVITLQRVLFFLSDEGKIRLCLNGVRELILSGPDSEHFSCTVTKNVQIVRFLRTLERLSVLPGKQEVDGEREEKDGDEETEGTETDGDEGEEEDDDDDDDPIMSVPFSAIPEEPLPSHVQELQTLPGIHHQEEFPATIRHLTCLGYDLGRLLASCRLDRLIALESLVIHDSQSREGFYLLDLLTAAKNLLELTVTCASTDLLELVKCVSRKLRVLDLMHSDMGSWDNQTWEHVPTTVERLSVASIEIIDEEGPHPLNLLLQLSHLTFSGDTTTLAAILYFLSHCWNLQTLVIVRPQCACLGDQLEWVGFLQSIPELVPNLGTLRLTEFRAFTDCLEPISIPDNVLPSSISLEVENAQ